MELANNLKKNLSESETTKLLWTGGRDSTFRLLQLLYTEGKEVQPIYVIDLKNRSPVYELNAMDKIRNELNKETVGTLLKPTIYVNRSGINIDEDILKAQRNIKKKWHLGKQYVWFASLCKQYGLQGVELSIEMPTNEERLVDSLSYHMQEDMVTADEKTIFNYFSLPIIQLTKVDMHRITKREGWHDIMELTWFCHHPIYHPFKKGIPCGTCNPCRYAINEGFGNQIPLILRYSGKYLKKIYNSSIINQIKQIKP